MGSKRLQKEIIPSSYSITLELSIDMNSYIGEVTIKAQISKPIKEITLHSKDLEIELATICVGTQCLLPKVKIEEKSETVRLENQNPVKGDIEIHLKFKGKVQDDLAGIYRSKYEHNGKTNYLITTQCEAPYARRIFPCFDEPDKKATFDLTVIIEKNLKAVSNMLPKSEQIENTKKKIQFKTTPKMSTYLFYLGIGDFEFAEDKYKDIIIRIVTTPGKTKNAFFALEHTKKYLEYFENYSEIPYPLEKLDLLAIPDFSSAAMENWGAITFRELVLLVDEKESSIGIKKRSAEVISHELWHQWSGNLVTMEWWNDLWLNESFANYMAYKAVDHYNPEWKVWNDYLSNELSTGLFKDSLKTTHPIEVEIKNTEEMSDIFDEISYQKGGSVLRMLEAHMGEESFRLGVSNYLKGHSYSNTTAIDLWNSLDNVNKDKKVKEMMKYWISEPGFPLVKIERMKTGIEISQERCNKKTSQVWPIPLSICTEDICYNILLEKKKEIHQIKEEYLKSNHEQFGFYRTKYSLELLKNLGLMVKEKKLNEQDRWGAQNDLWALCNLNQEEVRNYLEFLKNYLDEDNYNILSEISSSIRKLERLYYHESGWQNSKEKIINIMLPTYKRILEELGWNKVEEELVESTFLRNLCISFCGFAEDKSTIAQAQAIFAKKEIEIDTANSIYSIVAQNGGDSAYKEMLDRYLESKDIESKTKLLMGLYQFRDQKILKKALDFSLTDKVRAQDLRYVFQIILANPVTQNVMLDWAKSNWRELRENLEKKDIIFREFLNALIISQTTKNRELEIKEFLQKNKVGYERTKKNAFEILDMNLKFIEKNKKFLESY